MFKNCFILLYATLFFACSANDADKSSSGKGLHASTASEIIEVSKARVFESLPPHAKSMAFMKIRNQGMEDVILVGVRASRSETGELYIASGEKNRLGVGRMDSLIVPAGGVLALEEDSSYLNFFNLDKAWKRGEKVELTLLFAKQPEYRFEVEIE